MGSQRIALMRRDPRITRNDAGGVREAPRKGNNRLNRSSSGPPTA